ncbi:MAG: DUF3168 domain-containing protein [Anaerolineae bacterium]|nr:DUF3168 domain-containing protein [Anaerolineae bacterium]
MFTAIETALYVKLTTTGGTALYADRVYAVQAPLDTALPCCVFNYITGGDLNLSPSRLIDVRYRVEIAAVEQSQARQAADLIISALHRQPLTVSGYHHLATTLTELTSRVENIEGRQFWLRGAEFRIRLSQ